MDSTAAAAAARLTGHPKPVFCVALLHTPHQLIGFTAPNGKLYLSAVDVCRILEARDPHALAEHLAPCQMRNVAPFSGRLFLYPSSWVVEYHGLLHFLDHVLLLDRTRSTLPEEPARRLKKFLERGVVVVPTPATPPSRHPQDDDDSGIVFLKEADAETQIAALSTHDYNQDSDDYEDVEDVEPFAPAAAKGAGGATPAPSSIQPFLLWMFEQRSKWLYHRA